MKLPRVVDSGDHPVSAVGAVLVNSAGDELTAVPVSLGSGGIVNSLPVTGLTSTARSGTITAGGTPQLLMAANASRKLYRIQNQSTGILYIGSAIGMTLDQNSLALYPTQTFIPETNGGGDIYIAGATTGQQFHATEYS